MSTTWKLGTFALSMAYCAYLLGSLTSAKSVNLVQVAVAGFVLMICVVAFLGTLFDLRESLLRSKEPLRERGGRRLIP